MAQITAYTYRNYSFDENSMYATAVIWINAASNEISWQTATHVTPWHGSCDDQMGDKVLKFDCYAGTTRRANGEVRLKSTVLWGTLSGEYVGRDYRGRMVKMTPLSVYTHVGGDDGGGWQHTHTWSHGSWKMEDTWQIVDQADARESEPPSVDQADAREIEPASQTNA